MTGTGASIRGNAQPLVLNYVKGTLGLAYNGNLINAEELRSEPAYTGAIFQTTINTEVIACLIARERLHAATAEEAVARACRRLKGAYSPVVMSPGKLIGSGDSCGFSRCASASGIMPVSSRQRPACWIRSARSSSGMRGRA